MACFGPGPFALDTAIETMIRESFWNFMFLEERVGVQKKCPSNVSSDKSR